MRPLLLLIGACGALSCGAAAVHGPAGTMGFTLTGQAMPEFTTSNPRDWLNGPPLRLGALRGKVVLIDFWTFG